MTREAVYERWAPDDGPWSVWAKPVLFAQLAQFSAADEPVPSPTLPPALDARANAALVLDLPGEEALLLGLALAQRGFRPVPVFNATHGAKAVIDVARIGRWLAPGAELLEAARLPPDAPPAFLLDADRRRKSRPGPGEWDNRWLAFPQDFPSATFLRSRGIAEAVLVQRGASEPQEDLTHVLLPWQQAGIRMRAIDLAGAGASTELRVRTPSRFRRAWYRALAAFGLRRSNVGGFGAQVPQVHAGGSAFG